MNTNHLDRDDAAVADRLARVEGMLDAGEGAAQLWWNGWASIFTAGVLGSGTMSFLADRDEKAVWRISALRSGLGVVSVLAAPCPAAHGPAELRTMPESTPDQRALKLRAARETLRHAADVERLNRAWYVHGINLAVNLAFSVWVWRGYNHPGGAALSFTTGLVASETKIFTSPTRAIDDEQTLVDEERVGPEGKAGGAAGANSFEYKNLGYQQLGYQQLVRQPSWAWVVAPTPGGLALGGAF